MCCARKKTVHLTSISHSRCAFLSRVILPPCGLLLLIQCDLANSTNRTCIILRGGRFFLCCENRSPFFLGLRFLAKRSTIFKALLQKMPKWERLKFLHPLGRSLNPTVIDLSLRNSLDSTSLGSTQASTKSPSIHENLMVQLVDVV